MIQSRTRSKKRCACQGATAQLFGVRRTPLPLLQDTRRKDAGAFAANPIKALACNPLGHESYVFQQLLPRPQSWFTAGGQQGTMQAIK